MKNSAVKAMIASQFPEVELANIEVAFLSHGFFGESYEVTMLNDDKYQKWSVQIKFDLESEIQA